MSAEQKAVLLTFPGFITTLPTLLLMGKCSVYNTIFFKSFFLMWTILKVFIEFVTILLLLMFWFFGHEACEFLVSQPGLEPAPLH